VDPRRGSARWDVYAVHKRVRLGRPRSRGVAAALWKIRSLMCQNDSPMSQYLDFAPQAVLVCRIWSEHAEVSDRWDRKKLDGKGREAGCAVYGVLWRCGTE